MSAAADIYTHVTELIMIDPTHEIITMNYSTFTVLGLE